MAFTLKIDFDNEEVARHFGLWLCEAGEQDYWEWMKYREQEENGNITAINFHYSSPLDESFPANDKRRYKKAKFLNNLTIDTTCGRQDS